MLGLSFVLKQRLTNLRLDEPEIIKISELKNVLKFEHGSGNSKQAPYLAQTQTPK